MARRRRNPSAITKRLKALERAALKATTREQISKLHVKANDLNDVAYKAGWEQVDPQTPVGQLGAAVGRIVDPMYAEISAFKQWLTDVAEPAREARVHAARSAEMKALRDQMRSGDPYAAELRLAAARWKQNPKRRYVVPPEAKGHVYDSLSKAALARDFHAKRRSGYKPSASRMRHGVRQVMSLKALKRVIYLGPAQAVDRDGYTPDGRYFGRVPGTKIYSYEVDYPNGEYRTEFRDLRAGSRAAAIAALKTKYPYAKVSR